MPGATDVARHYDELDAWYRRLWGEQLHHGMWEADPQSPDVAARRLTSRLVAALEVGPGDRVVDVGCGYGATAAQIAEETGARVTGVTVSPKQHRRARRRAEEVPDLTFLLGDWLDNPLPDGRFDAAVACESLSHMASLPGAIAEIHRVLRPGGRAVVAAWTANTEADRWQRRLLLRPICEEGRLA
ncbi:MAG: cyclopropane-fatty-acyl-phospholipid synthase family protein, partial [Gemmatimonadota bacterium]